MGAKAKVPGGKIRYRNGWKLTEKENFIELHITSPKQKEGGGGVGAYYGGRTVMGITLSSMRDVGGSPQTVEGKILHPEERRIRWNGWGGRAIGT